MIQGRSPGVSIYFCNMVFDILFLFLFQKRGMPAGMGRLHRVKGEAPAGGGSIEGKERL